ncbi:MAG: hypothetical protein B6229_06115 [Spirochaetaceae bacterium 4572_7]|nr:MAG: hypothetical protein B6229_06115 [Spirochaetaceae bacterium 4572_7]
MALDLSYKGKKFPSYTFKVEHCKIKELCGAIGDQNPIYFDSEEAKKEGYKDSPAPLTFATLMSFWGYPEIWGKMTEIGIDIKRLLHAKEEYEYLDLIYPGDTLEGTVSVDALRDGKMQMAAFKTEFKRDGLVVLVAKMTIMVPPSN